MNIRRLSLLLMLIALWIAGAEQASAFYNPGTGRWLSKDPIEERGGPNLYAFVSNRPTTKIDRLGLQMFPTDPNIGIATNGQIHRSWLEHNNYIEFHGSCPCGKQIDRQSVTPHYEDVAPCILAKLQAMLAFYDDPNDPGDDPINLWWIQKLIRDLNSGGSASLGGVRDVKEINCLGANAELDIYMRSRFSASGITSIIAFDFTDCYKKAYVTWHCKPCSLSD